MRSYKRHACRVNIVASPAKSRLGNAVLQRNDRPSTVDDDRTLAAKVVQGMGIEDVKRRSGDPVIELRRQAFSLLEVASTDYDLAIAGLPQLGRNDSPGGAVANPQCQKSRVERLDCSLNLAH